MTTEGRRVSVEERFFPARDDRTFLQTACALFDAAIAQTRAKRLKKVSVMLHGISQLSETSADLFEPAGLSHERGQWEKLTDAMDTLNARYQACAVSLGPRREPPGGYAGAKIAFGRVPDLNDFATVGGGKAASRQSTQ